MIIVYHVATAAVLLIAQVAMPCCAQDAKKSEENVEPLLLSVTVLNINIAFQIQLLHVQQYKYPASPGGLAESIWTLTVQQ